MSELVDPLTVDLDEVETGRPRPEKSKPHLAMAIGTLAIGLAGALAENRGWVSGWPPPFHSLKHPWLGYYSAWLVSQKKSLTGRKLVAAMLFAGVAADVGAEMAQTLVGPTHDPLYSADWDRRVAPGADTNAGNGLDLVAALAGTAGYLAQSRFFSRQWPVELVLEPNPDPSPPNLIQSDEMAA